MNSSTRQLLRFLITLAFFSVLTPDFVFAATPDYQRLTAISVGSPKAVALDSAENVYIAEANLDRILIFDSAGISLGELTGLAKPLSVAVDQDGRIYVGNDDRDNVEVYGINDSGYSLLFKLGCGNGEFIQPNSIALDGQGNIYVVDYKADLVKVYHPDGTAWFSFGGTGNTNGLFNSPSAIAIDTSANRIIVTDQQKYIKSTYFGPQKGARVQVFDMNGSHLLSFGKFGQGEGLLTKPLGVAVDRDGNIYVADSHQHVIQAFNSNGAFLKTIYNLEKPFRTPVGLTISLLTDKMYIAALNSARIDIYERIPSFTVNVTSSPGGIISPTGTLSIKRDEIINFTITPDSGYKIGQVLVDDSPQDISQPITLTVVADHTVSATFEPDSFTVTSSAEAGGSVSPAGASQVTAGSSQTITITPDLHYHLADLLVDGNSIADIENKTEYTFNNVWEDHILIAQFAIDTFTVGSIASNMGNVTIPNGGIVAYGGSLTFTIQPRQGYDLIDVLVNGVSYGPALSHTIYNITEGLLIEPIFIESKLFERFETGDFSKLPWRTGGGTGWQVQKNERALNGEYIAQTPDTPASFLEVPLDVIAEGNISFWFALAGPTNTLRFLIDGVEQATPPWTGEWNWSEVLFAVTPGQHTFRWEYTGSSKEDAAWLDDIILPPYADPIFPMLDLKVNNSDGPVIIADKRDELTLSVMALYGQDWQPPADSQWVITRINTKSLLNDDDDSDDEGIAGKKLVRFTWQIPDAPTHIQALQINNMPKGEFTMVFGLYVEGCSMPVYYDTVDVIIDDHDNSSADKQSGKNDEDESRNDKKKSGKTK